MERYFELETSSTLSKQGKFPLQGSPENRIFEIHHSFRSNDFCEILNAKTKQIKQVQETPPCRAATCLAAPHYCTFQQLKNRCCMVYIGRVHNLLTLSNEVR